MITQVITIAGARKCSIKKVFYKSFIKITGKYLYLILFLNKVSDLLRNMYFPISFVKILRTLFSENLRWLLVSDVANLKEKKNRTHTM